MGGKTGGEKRGKEIEGIRRARWRRGEEEVYRCAPDTASPGNVWKR